MATWNLYGFAFEHYLPAIMGMCCYRRLLLHLITAAKSVTENVIKWCDGQLQEIVTATTVIKW